MDSPLTSSNTSVKHLAEVIAAVATREDKVSKRAFTMIDPTFIMAFTALVGLSYLVFLLGARNRLLRRRNGRSTPLPGFGILGDRVNEIIEIFLDSLAIYVHNEREWDCPRRLLCEANQRAAESGRLRGLLMYVSSLFVSFWLKDRNVSTSMDAMKKGRMGHNCTMQYPCPFSL